MTMQASTSRPLTLGTTGWRASDLNDPEIDRLWEQGAFEIIEGVLTSMPPAYFDGSRALQSLVFSLQSHLRQSGRRPVLGQEADLILSEKRVVRVDAVYLTPDDERRQEALNAVKGKPELRFGRLLIPPTLVIESISMGHESHDEETKQNWYAEFGIPNYWLFNAYRRFLRCLSLRDRRYIVDCEGKDDDELHPSLFPGLTIRLGELW